MQRSFKLWASVGQMAPLLLVHLLLAVAVFTAVSCTHKIDPEIGTQSKVCTEKKLRAYAETKMANDLKISDDTQDHEDHLSRLCAQYWPLFREDCQMDCLEATGSMSDVYCPTNDGQAIKLTEMKSVCENYSY